ncbi:MAG TPA: glycosyltransferase family 4 protein [Flavisolibacter sp.]|nr:glycosyltransferase family 4 protein [Flavisolibacter sp.]
MTSNMGRSVGFFSNTFWSIYNFRRSLIKQLIAEGYTVYAISTNDKYRPLLEEIGCKTVVIKSFDVQSTAVLKEARVIRQITRTLRSLPCEYIYTFTIKPNLYTALTTFLTGKKAILTVNGLGNVFSEGNMISRISLKLFKLAFKRAHRVFFQNRDDYFFFKEKISLDENKVSFVRGSGVNTDEFVVSVKPSLPGDRLIFLLACRLLKEKGVYEYIAAARRIKAKYPDVQFWLLGMEAKNPSAIPLNEIKKYADEGTISLLEKTDNVNGLLEKTDVMVLPSFYNEGIPRILLEGLSKGLPVITTDSVGCRETVIDERNGYMIEPRNVDSLENAFHRMIELPVAERDAMRRESRRLAEAEFNEEKVIEHYISIIREAEPVIDQFTVNAVGAR